MLIIAAGKNYFGFAAAEISRETAGTGAILEACHKITPIQAAPPGYHKPI